MNQIKLHQFVTPDDVAQFAADRIAELIRNKPDTVLGLATGSTPRLTYQKLIEKYREGLSFANVKTFNLDEYSGLKPDHPQSYRFFMNQNLFDHLDIDLKNTHVPDGMNPSPDSECQSYEEKIRACGGVDFWLLGIGQNGHIAFNEPGSEVDSRTRLVRLSDSTIQANSDGRFFSDHADVPKHALTAGIGTIRDARRILLLATGESKARAIHDAINGPIDPDCPASLLSDHPDCHFTIDQDASRLLP